MCSRSPTTFLTGRPEFGSCSNRFSLTLSIDLVFGVGEFHHQVVNPLWSPLLQLLRLLVKFTCFTMTSGGRERVRVCGERGRCDPGRPRTYTDPRWSPRGVYDLGVHLIRKGKRGNPLPMSKKSAIKFTLKSFEERDSEVRCFFTKTTGESTFVWNVCKRSLVKSVRHQYKNINLKLDRGDDLMDLLPLLV